MRKIPIENLYYLLSYAFNNLDEKDKVQVQLDCNTSIVDLFAKILINGTKILFKRGIEKSYRLTEEEVIGIKGKLNIGETLKRNLISHQRTMCKFDIYTNNILLNRILLSTIIQLVRTDGVSFDLKKDLAALRYRFTGVQIIELSKSIFESVRYNRNNQFYRFLISICELVYENSLPAEKSGRFVFTDFYENKNRMNQLYEAFIRNFYKREQFKYEQVGIKQIRWKFEGAKSEDLKFVPIMRTDITLESKTEKIIIDAKYYQETMREYYDNKKINTGNMYQIFSYLLNQEDGTDKTMKTKGILLYPKVTDDYNLTYWYGQHSIRIKTLDLSLPQSSIAKELLELI
jgi:5-methylcytosine-specific restriction enzyme subunit McrC